MTARLSVRPILATVLALILIVLSIASSAGAQQPATIPTVGWFAFGGQALAAIIRDRAEGFIVDSDPVTGTNQMRIVEFAAANRLPTMYVWRRYVDAGGLISYGPSFYELWRRAAGYVDKILKGAKPSDLPIEQPTKFAMVINLKTANTLGLTIPPSILARADEVIQ
jgi:putative ABC transport system substrate-binding protein